MPDSPQPTIDALVQFVADFVSDHFQETGQPTPGASLAAAIRRKFAAFTYEQLGITRLADVVAQAESRGLVIRNRQVRHMELLPTQSGPFPSMEAEGGKSEAPVRWVRPDVWRALVFLQQNMSHFLERETGKFVSVSSDNAAEVAEYSGNSQYAKLDPLPSETQKDWAKGFIKDQGLEDLSLETTDGRWWTPFFGRVKQDRDVSSAWNRYRAAKVGTYLEEWASRNGVNPQMFFVAAKPDRKAFVAQAASVEGDEELIRRAILESIKEMTFDELKAIAIPVRCILHHFRTR